MCSASILKLYSDTFIFNLYIPVHVCMCGTNNLLQELPVVYFVQFSLTIMILTKMNCYYFHVGRFIE